MSELGRKFLFLDVNWNEKATNVDLCNLFQNLQLNLCYIQYTHVSRSLNYG